MQETDFHFDELFDADHGHAESSKPHRAHVLALK